MFKFIKNCFKEVSVKVNEQELTGGKKALALVLSTLVLTFVLGVVAIIIVGTCALFVGAVALMLCIAPIALVVEGIKQIVSITRDFYKLKKKENDITNKYKDQLKQIEEAYNEKREMINNTIESIENSTSIVKDELGEEVVVQELAPITLEDMEAYIRYIAQFKTVDAHILISNLAILKELKSQLDITSNCKEREKLEQKYDILMFSSQERISKHIEQINNMNTNFDKGAKKRRLFKKNI